MLEPTIFSLDTFLAQDLEPTSFVLSPWLPEQGLALISSKTGTGKTWLGLSIAIAIASGGSVLGWHAPKARRVLYVDGEMSLTEMQDRCRALLAGLHNEAQAKLARENLFLYCDGAQSDGITRLSTPQGRKLLKQVMVKNDIKVCMIDNISTVCNDDEENEAGSWTGIQDWQRASRREGFTIVWFHHTGKADSQGNTKQRGTSKREDMLNSSMILNPAGRNSFYVNWTKHRSFLPPEQDMRVKIILSDDESEAYLAVMENRKEVPKEELEKPKGEPNYKAIERSLDQ